MNIDEKKPNYLLVLYMSEKVCKQHDFPIVALKL